MPPNKVSKAWCCQAVLWLPEPSGDCLPHPVWKIPLFSSEIYESSSVPFFCSSPLWSHSPLVDCLPNGHWQMMLKIAGLAPLLQTAIEVGQCCCFLMPYSVWSELFNIVLSYLYTSPISVSFLCLSFCLNRSWWMFSHASHKGFRLHKGCAAECYKSNDFLLCALTYCTIDDLHLIKTRTFNVQSSNHILLPIASTFIFFAVQIAELMNNSYVISAVHAGKLCDYSELNLSESR